MNILKSLLILFVLGLTFQSCSTILSGTSDNISIKSNPEANITIVNNKGMEMFTGKTPAEVRLSRKYTYTVKLNIAGFKEKSVFIDQAFNTTAICNLAGIVGWGVDFLTGAIYSLEPTSINVSLDKAYLNGKLNKINVKILFPDENNNLREMIIPLESETTVATK